MIDDMGGRCSYANLDCKIKILPNAANLIGTSAQLLSDDLLTVEELLYGMMLPSGNDAAQSLAMYFGVLFQFDCKVEPNNYLTTVDEQQLEIRLKEGKFSAEPEPQPNETQ